MPALKYIGPFDAVEVYGLGVAVRGVAVEVDDKNLSASLLEQPDNWAPAVAVKKTEKES